MPPRHKLRDLRLGTDLTQAEAAKAVDVSTETYSRWERGTTDPRPGLLKEIARAFGVDLGHVVEAFTDDTSNNGLNGHTVPLWLDHLASLEHAATRLDAYEPVVIHGLLQTAGYAAAVERVGGFSADAIDERVAVRLARQQVLYRPEDPLQLHVILDESTLHRVAGAPSVMADQVAHLVDVAQLPNVTLQVLPLSEQAFRAAFGAFKLLTSEGPRPFMACVEDGGGPHYLDRAPEIERHTALFAALAAAARDSLATLDLLATIQKENAQ